MEKFKDILALIIIAIVAGAMFIALVWGAISIAQALLSAGLGFVVCLIAFLIVVFVVSKIIGWAFDRIL